MGRSERGVRVVALGLVALGVVQAILGIAWRDGPSTGIGEKVYYLGSATGTFINRGHFGAFLCLALGSAWGLAAALFPLVPDEVRRHWRSRRRSSQPPNVLEVSGDKVPRLVVLGFAVSVMGVALVLSQSRAPILAFAIASLAVAAYCWRRRDETFHFGIAVGVLAVSAFLSGVGFGVRGAFGRFANLLSTTDVSFTSRVQVWKEGLAAVLDAPVFGAGPGAWRIGWALHEAGPHLYDFSHAHNEIVERLVEIGIVGTAAMLGLAAIWVHRCRMGLDVAEHGPRTAVGVGAAVGVVAVALQSLGDFPLHTPGVLLATGVCAGVARGALTERAGPGRPTMWLLPLAGTVLFSGVAVARDLSYPGTREERLSEHPAWIHREGVDDSVEQRQSRLEEARALADVSPLDPWAHVATALGAARVAVDAAAGRSEDGAWEERAWEAEKAVARAMKLRPRLPRLELACARVLLALAESGSGEDARRERATVMLAHAISLDAWRAREAFEMASTLPADSLSRMADAAPAEATSRARVRYELSRALHRRKDADGAYGALLDAMEADPTFGPALYEAGVQLQARGEGEAARGYFERFLQAKERTPGMEGWALLHMSDLDGAEVRFRRIVAEKPQNLWAWEGLAEIARVRGDKAAELQVWRRVVRINPEHRTAGARIAALAGP